MSALMVDDLVQKVDWRWRPVLSGFMLLVHAGLLLFAGAGNGVTLDEVGHLPAGVCVWELGRFDLFRVNPPLVRSLAALPAVLANPRMDWSSYGSGRGARPE